MAVSSADVRAIVVRVCARPEALDACAWRGRGEALGLIFADHVKAVSIGRSKSGRRTHGFLKQQLRKHFVWRPESQYSARPVVKRICNRLKIGHITGKFCPLREVFPDEPVRVLVSSALPRGMGVGEIYRQVGICLLYTSPSPRD